MCQASEALLLTSRVVFGQSTRHDVTCESVTVLLHLLG